MTNITENHTIQTTRREFLQTTALGTGAVLTQLANPIPAAERKTAANTQPTGGSH